MIIIPRRYTDPQDNKQMKALIEPDNTGPWALRYLWIQHRSDNNKFYDSYFDPGKKDTGFNVRKLTSDLSEDWSAHNQIFFDSAANGNLIWRVKVANPVNRSIDYIEIWKNYNIVNDLFGEQPSITINDQTTWNHENRKQFVGNLFDKGFDVREWSPFPTISKRRAMHYYIWFSGRSKKKEPCIVNTPWNPDLNPLLAPA